MHTCIYVDTPQSKKMKKKKVVIIIVISNAVPGGGGLDGDAVSIWKRRHPHPQVQRFLLYLLSPVSPDHESIYISVKIYKLYCIHLVPWLRSKAVSTFFFLL